MELARGVRDFPPKIQIIREELLSIIKYNFELYGFSPFSSPTIERLETLQFKFQGQEDVMNELFTFSDRGGRQLGLRFDLTIPLCRFVASNKDLKFPFKRYEIGRVYRDGPVKLGRYREFWQCDADIVGSNSLLADAECIRIACSVLSDLKMDFIIKFNNIKVLNSILDKLGVDSKHDVIRIIDKLAKQGYESVLDQLSEIIGSDIAKKLLSVILVDGSTDERIKFIEEFIGVSDGLDEIKQLCAYLSSVSNIEFDPSLARGLNYYTGTVFEGFCLNSPVTSSICAGGRYDNIIGQMRGSDFIPGVGISFGVDPLTDILISKKHKLSNPKLSIFVIPINTVIDAYNIVSKLRSRGINSDIDLMGRSISKNLDFASKMGFSYVIILGSKDLSNGVCTVRNMRSGDEIKVPLSDINSFNFDF